jgi:hypothetical protein
MASAHADAPPAVGTHEDALGAKPTERKKSTPRKAPPATTTYEHRYLLDGNSKGSIARAYERYLQLPAPVVFASISLVGTVPIALCVLAFYLLWLLVGTVPIALLCVLAFLLWQSLMGSARQDEEGC